MGDFHALHPYVAAMHFTPRDAVTAKKQAGAFQRHMIAERMNCPFAHHRA